MYTIKMNSDKSLIKTVTTTLYQREKLVDKIQFLFPTMYEDFNLQDFTIVLKYLDQANIAHAEILEKDSELYEKEYIRCVLPVDTDLSEFAGDITIMISLSKLDSELETQYVLHTGETTITISPLKDLYGFVPDESLDFVDQMIGKLDAKIEALDKLTNAKNVTDDL